MKGEARRFTNTMQMIIKSEYCLRYFMAGNEGERGVGTRRVICERNEKLVALWFGI